MVASGRYPLYSPGRPRVDPAGVTSAPCRAASAHQPAPHGSRKLGTQKPCANTVLGRAPTPTRNRKTWPSNPNHHHQVPTANQRR